VVTNTDLERAYPIASLKTSEQVVEALKFELKGLYDSKELYFPLLINEGLTN
jgi:hypothetical protein